MSNIFRFDRTPERLKQTGFRLCGAAWILFLVSMFLPAIGSRATDWLKFSLTGWDCALLTLGLATSKDANIAGRAYFFSFVLANVLMLVSPLLLRRDSHGRGRMWLSSFLLIIAFVDVLALLLPLSATNDSGWGIGYYVWMASFGLMAAGSLLIAESRRIKSAPVTVKETLLPQTPEEIAAERELHDYLRSV